MAWPKDVDLSSVHGLLFRPAEPIESVFSPGRSRLATNYPARTMTWANVRNKPPPLGHWSVFTSMVASSTGSSPVAGMDGRQRRSKAHESVKLVTSKLTSPVEKKSTLTIVSDEAIKPSKACALAQFETEEGDP